MMIHEITAQAGAHKKRIRVGRGESSGHGKTCGRGTKGSGARAGGGIHLGSEGGNMPLFRRLPKRGFNNNAFRQRFNIVNVGDLKPAEIGTEFFLQMAWDIDRWNAGNLAEYLPGWAARGFSIQASRCPASHGWWPASFRASE